MEFDDYRGNSHKSRESAKPVKVKTVNKIASGKVASQSGLKRLTDEFIAENAANVGDYVWHDIIVPAVKGMLVDAIKGSADIVFEGRVSGRSNKKNSYISYDTKSERRSGSRGFIDVTSTSEQRYSRSGSYRFDNIIVETRGEAEDILFTMGEIISEYEFVTVADLYDMVGINGSHTDNKYGWRSIEGSSMVRTRDGYMLRFPKPVSID